MARPGRGIPNHPIVIGAPQAALASPGGGGTPGTGRATVEAVISGVWVPVALPAYLVAGRTGAWAPAGVYIVSGGTWQ